MAKKKVCAQPGALVELLKSKNLTQMDVASDHAIDRKTLAKINRGEPVKEQTLLIVANKLKVPAKHFFPPAGESVHREINQLDDFLLLMLHKLDAQDLVDLLYDNGWFQWQLNVHQVADEAVIILAMLEKTVEELAAALNHARLAKNAKYNPSGPVEYGTLNSHSLTQQLDGLKQFDYLADLLEDLAKHGLVILGAEFLYWNLTTKTELVVEGGQRKALETASRILLSVMTRDLLPCFP